MEPIIAGGYPGYKYWACPCCKHEVGGYTNRYSENWGTHQDKFCPECGTKIDWKNICFTKINS